MASDLEKKAAWPAGPWHHEPDHLVWRTRVGYPGQMLRNSMGSWCGYVAVPPGHPAHGKKYDDVDVEVHGGLTYGSLVGDDERPTGRETAALIDPDQPPIEEWWLFGFDCGHSGDLAPGMLNFYRDFADRQGHPSPAEYAAHYGTYRDMAYVQAEVEQLAVQLWQLTL